jgi:hypothetical protein
MAATSELAPYKLNVPIETDDGTLVAIAAGTEEAVQVLVPYQSEDEPEPDVSVWWDGSASPRAVRDWVAETIQHMNNPALECRVQVWADEAPEEGTSYHIESIGRIAEDIQKWAGDGAVGCSIAEPRPNREVVYMWAELNSPDAGRHHGEVGLRYATKALETEDLKPVFLSLLRYTAIHDMSKEEVEGVYSRLRTNVLSIANARLHHSGQD